MIIINIESLKRKRGLNVQEQNALQEHRILSEGTYWRQNGIPDGLQKVLRAHGVNPTSCLVFEYEQDSPGISTDEGFLLTEDGCFIQFDMDLTPDRTDLVELYKWKDVTADFEVSKSKPGTGSTRGYLCHKVLRQLNQER